MRLPSRLSLPAARPSLRPHVAAMALLGSLVWGSQASAQLIALDLQPRSLASTSLFTGEVLEDDTQAFSYLHHTGCAACGGRRSHVISGELRSWVVRALDDTIDFYWQASATASGPIDQYGTHWGGAAYLGLKGFDSASFEIQGGWITDGGGDMAPRTLTRNTGELTAELEGTLQFDFGDFTMASTQIAFIETDAPWYARTAVADVTPAIWFRDGAQMPAFSPAPIPEPGTYALFAAGLAGLGWMGRRRAAGAARKG